MSRCATASCIYQRPDIVRTCTVITERDVATGLFAGYIPGLPGAHSQGETLEALDQNLREVLETLLKKPFDPKE